MPGVFRVYWRTAHVTRSAIEAKAAFSAPINLSTHDDHDHVDRAPADGDGALLWNVTAGLAAGRGGGWPNILPTIGRDDRVRRRGHGLYGPKFFQSGCGTRGRERCGYSYGIFAGHSIRGLQPGMPCGLAEIEPDRGDVRTRGRLKITT